MIKRIVTMDELTPCLYLEFNVPDEDFNLEAAAKQAAMAYAATPCGKKILASNNGFFNWGDLVDVPVEFCKRFGFEILKFVNIDCSVDHNEILVEAD